MAFPIMAVLRDLDREPETTGIQAVPPRAGDEPELSEQTRTRAPVGQPLAARPLLLIGFGVLLGWSAANVFSFYGADSPDHPLSQPRGAAAPGPDRLALPQVSSPDAAGDRSPTLKAEAPVALRQGFELLGGNEPPRRETLFCAILIVDPNGCEAEANRASTEAAHDEMSPPSPSADLTQAGRMAGREEGSRRSRDDPAVPDASLARRNAIRTN